MLLRLVNHTEAEQSEQVFFQGPTEDLRVLTLFKIGFELDGATAHMGWPSGLAICDDWRAMLNVVRQHAGQARLADIVRPPPSTWSLEVLPVDKPTSMNLTFWKQCDSLLRGYRCTTYKQSQRPQWGFTFSLNTKPVKQRQVSISPPPPELVELCQKKKVGMDIVVLMHPGGRAWYCFKASTDLTPVDDDDWVPFASFAQAGSTEAHSGVRSLVGLPPVRCSRAALVENEHDVDAQMLVDGLAVSSTKGCHRNRGPNGTNPTLYNGKGCRSISSDRAAAAPHLLVRLKKLRTAKTDVSVHNTTDSVIDKVGGFLTIVCDPTHTNLPLIEEVRTCKDLRRFKKPFQRMRDCPYPCNYGKSHELPPERELGRTAATSTVSSPGPAKTSAPAPIEAIELTMAQDGFPPISSCSVRPHRCSAPPSPVQALDEFEIGQRKLPSTKLALVKMAERSDVEQNSNWHSRGRSSAQRSSADGASPPRSTISPATWTGIAAERSDTS